MLVTPDEVPDPYNLAMRARINGGEVSYGHTKGMFWTFEQIVAYVSQSETLYPGEFFFSGTGTVQPGVRHQFHQFQKLQKSS